MPPAKPKPAASSHARSHLVGSGLETEEHPEGGQNGGGDGALREEEASRSELPQQQKPLRAPGPRNSGKRQCLEHDGLSEGKTSAMPVRLTKSKLNH